jgi:hypothetical protein
MVFNYLYKIVSYKIVYLLDVIYYKNLKRLYPQNDLNEILILKKFPVIKPDYFIFLQFYFIYKFFYNLTYNNIYRYSFFLHSYYINGIIFDKLSDIYKYNSNNNILFFKNISEYVFLYMLFLKIYLLNIGYYKKGFILFSISSFYFLHCINRIYKERLKSIELNKDFYHPFKILIITPNKNKIINIIKKTNYFTYENMLFFINLYIYIFI